MKHTSQYQFHLIESTDAFSAAPLNENAQKAETLLSELNQKGNALEAAVAQLGNAKAEFGSYTGTSAFGAENPNTLSFSFQPKLVLLISSGQMMVAVQGSSVSNCIQGTVESLGDNEKNFSWANECTWEGNSLSWYNPNSANHQFNSDYRTYFYLALGD